MGRRQADRDPGPPLPARTSASWLPRNNEVLTRLPKPLLDLAIGSERYVDPALPVGSPVVDDVFAGL